MLFGVEPLGYCITIGMSRDGLMKGGIKYSHLGDIRSLLQGDLDPHDVGRVMQRSKRDHVPHLLHDRFVDQYGSAEGLAAMYHAMPDGKQL